MQNLILRESKKKKQKYNKMEYITKHQIHLTI